MRSVAPLPALPVTSPAVSLISLLRCLWRDRLVVGGLALLAASLVGAAVLLFPRSYRSSASFIPSSARSASPLAGMAAQLGMGLTSGDAAQSPAFYAALLRSREMQSTIVLDTLQVGARRTSLTALWGEGETAPLRMASAVRQLDEVVDVDVDPRTGLVQLTVETTDPEVSHAIAEQLLVLVNRFNLERRQTQASNERRFTEQRITQLRTELSAAEARLQLFLDRNRVIAPSSAQRFDGERLQRDVTVRRGVLDALSQSFEQARLDEVRDTPVITVVDRPALAVLPAPRGVVAKTVIGLLVGLLLGVSFSWGRLAWLRLLHDSDFGTPAAVEHSAAAAA